MPRGKATPAPPASNPFRNQKPIQAPAPIRRPVPAPKPKRLCPNKECNDPKIEDGICENCGTIVDDSNIVSEVQFGETSGGAAVVQGSFVGAESGGARGPTGLRNSGGGDRVDNSAEHKRTMQQMATRLDVNSEQTIAQGMQIFKLASQNNFMQGRRMDMVIAVCLYTSCRKIRPCRVMLIDFADLIQVNVFKLGHTFKCLHSAITLAKDGIQPILPEDLVYRFAAKLDFGNAVVKVAEDAVRMVKRMSMDWMVMGRRPSGVCGACLILAARMNNFRRTVTEVVYVVKVTTNTIQKRLEEFKLTPSSSLTVDEFVNNEFLEEAHDPPSFYEKQEEFIKTKKTRKRRRKHLELGEDEQDPGKRQKTVEPQTQPEVELRRDADGFAIPHPPVQPQEIPIDPDLIEAQAGTTMEQLVSQFGDADATAASSDQDGQDDATNGTRTVREIHVSDGWGSSESELESQITEMINDPNSVDHLHHYAQAVKRAEVHMRNIERQRDPAAPIVNMDTLIGEDEFADDPEVKNCLLSVADSEMKEKIWVNENREWLRKKQMKEAEMRKRAAGPPKATRNRKPKPRIGEGQASPASSAGEAAASLLKERSWSRKINYEALSSMFHTTGSRLGSATTSRAGSVTGDDSSVVESSVAGSVAGDNQSVAGTPRADEEDSIAASSVRAPSPAPSSIAETSNAGDDDWKSTFKRPNATDDFGDVNDDDDVDVDPGMGDVDDYDAGGDYEDDGYGYDD